MLSYWDPDIPGTLLGIPEPSTDVLLDAIQKQNLDIIHRTIFSESFDINQCGAAGL